MTLRLRHNPMLIKLHINALLITFLLTSCLSSNDTLASQTVIATTTHPPRTVTPSPPPSPTATPTTPPFYVTATVWENDPFVPILAYHQFSKNGRSTATRVRLSDFRAELERLYQSGYTAIPLHRWLAGDLRVPDNRRPIILTMDDLFYGNQIRLGDDNIPSTETGLGVAWEFYQEHPDFGFHWALFSSLGDKTYGDSSNPEWQLKLAEVIVWLIEHDAMIYNHTYTHANLAQTDPPGITWSLSMNDKYLYKLLTLAGREDLIPQLGNIFAVPFGKWPRDAQGETTLINYKTPSGIPLQAIMDADYIYRPNFMPPPYASQFNRWRVPRIVATLSAIDYLVENSEKVPVAKSCQLGPLEQLRSDDTDYLAEQIHLAVEQQRCPQGIYATERFVFRAHGSQVELLLTADDHP